MAHASSPRTGIVTASLDWLPEIFVEESRIGESSVRTYKIGSCSGNAPEARVAPDQTPSRADTRTKLGQVPPNAIAGLCCQRLRSPKLGYLRTSSSPLTRMGRLSFKGPGPQQNVSARPAVSASPLFLPDQRLVPETSRARPCPGPGSALKSRDLEARSRVAA